MKRRRLLSLDRAFLHRVTKKARRLVSRAKANAHGTPLEQPLHLDDDTFLLVLTGAGMSAESGIPTFRGVNGLWNQYPVERLASPEGFAADPALVWRFYSQRRAQARTCAPHAGHQALVAAEQRLGDRFLLATQNVDGLHRRAGTQRVVELHGNLGVTRCSRCARPPFEDTLLYEEEPLPRCDACGQGLLRPHIVWFGELLDPAHLGAVERFIERGARARLVFLAVGTSGAVYPAAGMVDWVRDAGGETWLVNADPADNASRFEHTLRGKAGELLPRFLGAGT
jgi:NAD-dependent deacetylase